MRKINYTISITPPRRSKIKHTILNEQLECLLSHRTRPRLGREGGAPRFLIIFFIAYAVFLYKVCFLLNRIKPFSHFVLASTLSSGQYKKTVFVKYSKIQLFDHFKNIFKKKFILYAPFAITVYVVAPSVARQSWGD